MTEQRSVDEGKWFGPERQAAFEDLLRVFEADFDRIRLASAAWAQTRPEQRALLEALADDGGIDEKAAVSAALRGDWLNHGRLLERRGALQADLGLALRASFEGSREVTRHLLPRLIEAYGSDSARLGSALQALTDFADKTTASTLDGYLARTGTDSRAREEDLSITLDSIGDAVIVTDVHGNVSRMNPIAERLTGYSFDESRGRPLEQVFRIENEDTRQVVESPVRRVLREGTIVGLANHTELVAKDGTRRPIADSGAPVRHTTGEIRGVVLVFRDVSEERRAEAALRHWERIFQHATWGVATANVKDIRFEAVNPMYAEMHGYTVEELVGAPVSLMWAPETRADMERHAAETHGHGRLVVETTHLKKDGTPVPVEVIATTIKNERGEVEWFVANVQDITERRALQQSRIRAIQLEAENRRIEEANRLKSEFLANMSHELRTPLNSIIGFAELLFDEQVGPVQDKQKEFLGDILSGGLHLLRLINDVLDLAKVEAGKLEFRPEPVDLGLLVHGVVQSLSSIASGKGIEVESVTDPSLGDVVLDPARLKQILYNYVSNALKFTPDGGAVSVRAIREDQDQFRIEVQDTGPGVAPDDVPRLFIPFQQLESGATRRHGGTGLGLALTKRLAEAQGGRVGMHAAPGGGSVFFASLPCRPILPRELFERRADVPRRTSVLVVENDAADRNTVVTLLRKAGYEADGVSTSTEAEVAWRKHAYDAVTLNLLIPDARDLPALLARIRQDRRRAGVPVVGVTTAHEPGAAPALSLTGLVSKPINAPALLAMLEQGGAPASRGRPVLVVDDDVASLRLMEATLAKLGHEALCFSNAADALAALDRVRPVAVVLDLLMPNMDGFAFLDHFRSSAENTQIPVMVWTVKDLSRDEQLSLAEAAHSVVQKGTGDQYPLSAALRALLPTKDCVAEKGPTSDER